MSIPIITDILINDNSWIEERSDIESYLQDLMKKIIPETKLNKFLQQNIQIEVSLVLTSDDEIKNLNKIYREKDKATNVLSFPLLDFNNINKKSLQDNFIAIGDIILSYATIKKEALEQNKKFIHHTTHLVIHSLLHLIGYDHENDKDATIMENLEIEILKKLAIDNPYTIN